MHFGFSDLEDTWDSERACTFFVTICHGLDGTMGLEMVNYLPLQFHHVLQTAFLEDWLAKSQVSFIALVDV